MESSPAEPLTTIVIVPRERFSLSDRSLQNILDNTEAPYRLVYVDGKSPKNIQAFVASKAHEKGFTLIRTERHPSPNEARNLSLDYVTTKYVVFLDNDVFVESGWLKNLETCAQETGAWVVGPLYYQGDPEDQIVHVAGGFIELGGKAPHRSFSVNNRYQHKHINDVPELRREPCDFVEFHCLLVRKDVFAILGPLDERLLSTREHLDLCLAVRNAGGEVYYDPNSVVTYQTPPPFSPTDLPYYWKRWSEAWSAASLARFIEKHGIEPSYADLIRHTRRRRQMPLVPIRQAVHRRFGRSAGHAVGLALNFAETAINRVMVRVPKEAPYSRVVRR